MTVQVPTVPELAHRGLADYQTGGKGQTSFYKVSDQGHREMGEAMHKNAQEYHAVEPTTLHCPSLPEGDNTTHHLVPSQARASLMKCATCGQTEDEIRRAALA